MIKKYIACVLSAAAVLSSISVFADTAERAVYTAIRDTYVSEEAKDSIYGLEDSLELSAETGKQKKIFLGFRIRENIGEYDRVLLKIKPISVTEAAGETAAEAEEAAQPSPTPEVMHEPLKPIISISQTTEHEWLQTKINWNNAPTAGNKISDVEVKETEEISVDVSAYVKASRDAKGYICFLITAANEGYEYSFPSIEGQSSGSAVIEIVSDALEPEEKSAAANSDNDLIFKKIDTKYPTVPDMPSLPDEFDIDEYTVTRYKPWMLLYHLTSPQQIKNGYYGGDAGQMMWTLEYAPTYPDRILLGTDTEGIWRSENGGVSWSASNKGLMAIGTTALAFDPTDEDFVLVLSNSGTNKETNFNGIYKSTDGGNTWKFKKIVQNLRSHNYKGFAFGPRDENGKRRIYLINNNKTGLLVSDDEGETWSYTGNLEGLNIYEVHTHGNKVIISTDARGIIISDDGGETWYESNEGLPQNEDGSICGVRSLAINPVNPDYWLCTALDKCLYTSTDGGKTWELTCDNKQFSNVTPAVVRFGAPDENGDCRIYAAVGTIQRNLRWSEDGGKTFNVPVHHNTDAYLVDNWGWGVEPMAIHPTDPDTLIISLDGEPYITRDGGRNLYPTSSGYSGNRCVMMDIAPDGSDYYMSFIDRGFVHAMYSGRGEKYPMVDSFPIEDRFWIRANGSKTTQGIAVNWDNPNEVWINIGGGSGDIRLSTDGGRTFKTKLANIKTGQIFIHPQNPDIIYSSCYISYDHGETWTTIPYHIRAVSPVNGDIIYARTEQNTYRSKDAGKTWSQLTSTAIKYTQRFTCDAVDEDKVYIGSNGHITIVDGDVILRTCGTDNGLGLSAGGASMYYCVAQDPNNPSHLITANNDQGQYTVGGGVYESFDDGVTWRAIEGMAGTADVWYMKFHPTEQRVYMGTSNGTWVYECDRYYDMDEQVYLDVAEDNPQKDKIEYLYNQGYSYQYHDGYFRPAEGMRKGRFAQMVAKAFNFRQTKYLDTFSDIPRSSIYYTDVQALYENGIIRASSDGKFAPSDDITYDEAAMMLYNAAKMKHIPMNGEISEMKNYVDDSVSKDFQYAVYQLKLLGIIDDTVNYRSGTAATNTDIAVMFYNFLQLVQ